MAPLKTHQLMQRVSATKDDEQPQQTPTDIRKLLPDTVLEEIVSWAPARTVLRWKIVSKPWLRMLENPFFARNHLSRAPFSPLLVFSFKSSIKSSRTMRLLEGQTVEDLDRPGIFNKFKPMSRIDFDTRRSILPPNVNAVSCEGLVCWAARDDHRGDYVIICNPVTNEYVSVSASTMDGDKWNVFIGIGFCQATKKFELLRMSSFDGSLWSPEVRTVGDTSWRSVGDGESEWNFHGVISEVVYVNGAIYWSYDSDSTICSFHFGSAKFQVIPLPQMKYLMLETNSFASRKMSLGVLANSLCVSLAYPKDGHVELWIVENDGVSQVEWNKLYDLETKTTDLKRSNNLWSRGQYNAIKYLSQGEILMHVWRGKFIMYDPNTKEVLHICFFEDSIWAEDQTLDAIADFQVVPHVPSVMKLKEALNIDEEAGVKVMKDWEK